MKSKDKKIPKKTPIIINTDKEARNVLRQFITVMSLHAGFNRKNRLSIEVDLKLFKK
jgi:hypothetical protein